MYKLTERRSYSVGCDIKRIQHEAVQIAEDWKNR